MVPMNWNTTAYAICFGHFCVLLVHDFESKASASRNCTLQLPPVRTLSGSPLFERCLGLCVETTETTAGKDAKSSRLGSGRRFGRPRRQFGLFMMIL